jgi:hypothetical protein
LTKTAVLKIYSGFKGFVNLAEKSLGTNCLADPAKRE